jgi:DNA-binding NarL/FixJ family response regulator
MSHVKSTVLLADDHPGILDMLSKLLFRDFEIVGAVQDGAAAVAATVRLNPDIVVMDISMPVMDGIQAMCEIRQMGVNSEIVVLSGLDDPMYVASALEAGARGYVLKSRMSSDLVLALEEVLAGRTFLPRSRVSSKTTTHKTSV